MPEAILDPEIPGHPPPVCYPSWASIALQPMPPLAQFPYMGETMNQAQTSVLSYGASAPDGTSNPYGTSTFNGVSNPLGTSTRYGTSNPCGTSGAAPITMSPAGNLRCRVAASTTAIFSHRPGVAGPKENGRFQITGSPVKSPCPLTSRMPGQSSRRVNSRSCQSRTLPGQNMGQIWD